MTPLAPTTSTYPVLTLPLSALGGDGGGSLLGFALVVVVVAVLSGALYGLSRAVHYWKHSSHLNLFLSLCRHHELDSRSKGLLRRVVRCYRLSQPGLVFVDPRWLDAAAKQAPLRAYAGDLKQLRENLFAWADH